MSTETMSPRYLGIDTWPTGDILEAMAEGQLAAAAAVRAALPALGAAAEAAVARLKQGGRLVYVGAGTSGRIAVQDGAELPPTFNWPADRLVLIMAGGEAALLRSIEGAEDDEGAAAAAVSAHRIAAGDVVVAIAASGATRFTRRVQALARQAGALTIGVANNRDAPLLAEAEHALLLETGPEVIAGSTRMKAGTAQKAALNLLSSLIMIRLGRVHDGLMVDMQAMNRKLVDRAERMVRHVTGVDATAARAALDRSGGHVKTAVLVARGLTPEAAHAALAAADQSLRAALRTLDLE
jgi:N-acetylmuramic acid 6-phosphate etherase